ncbi:ROK family protein [Cohnella nanjingensis]|uniref:ROK family protein n=1 Tax=Cohnella nanjingensis TaxID=1387779 RepID=A0A7X0VGT0_9BACL|nr:ROK family protein [Cohnella nanjingensis]MBB6673432.1 ROK family protein [Cohnella nanjingensis]
MVRGQWGGAGEIGHMSVDYHGRTCICGGIGCLEEYASGTSISKRMNELLLAEAAYDAARDGPVDTRETVKRWLLGDPVAGRVMNEAFEALGTAISSLSHLFNPELVVIGGGLAEVGEPVLRRIEGETRKKTMPSFFPERGIQLAANGNRSAMIGAAMQLWV